MAKISIEDIRAELQNENWKLISEEYKNLKTEMLFLCPEGHQVYSTWEKMRSRRECPICKQNQYKVQDDKVIPKKKGTQRVLALDQATHTTGWSIFDGKELVKYGTFTTSCSDEIRRDNTIKMWLLSMIHMWRPDAIGIEGIQFQDESSGRTMGVTVFETLARLQGILMEACYEEKISYKVCPTNTWRHHCGVKGKSRSDKKRSMQLIAKELYDITISEDEADAIGIGKYMAESFIPKKELVNWE